MSTPAGTLTVADLDALPARDAEAVLRSCCGAAAWVRGMLARRPFGSLGGVLDAAREMWWSLAPDDWLEAFSHHPRIGERRAATADARATRWSADEQQGATTTTDAVRDALARGNREYERRFGHIYLICASGRSAEEMLALLRERLANDPATELRVAAAEQEKITELRLRKLLAHDSPPSTSTA